MGEVAIGLAFATIGILFALDLGGFHQMTQPGVVQLRQLLEVRTSWAVAGEGRP